jgi:hypothetical protein
MAVFHAKRKKTCYFTDNKIEKIRLTDIKADMPQKEKK